MAYFEDLQPCTEFARDPAKLVAVGWLSKNPEYSRGAVDLELLEKLDELGFWRLPGGPRGVHSCPLCPEGRGFSTTSTLFIPSNGFFYVAPGVLTHLIREHGYRPPAAFVEAVKTGPAGQTPAYRRAVLEVLDRTRSQEASNALVLGSIEPVRQRVGMYFGSHGAFGLAQTLFEVVGNSLDQHLADAATRLSVVIDKDGWVTVEDDGRGIPVEAPPHRGLSMLELIFRRLHSEPTFDGHQGHVHVTSGLTGVGLAAVNAVCERLELESRRNGIAYKAAFERGALVESLSELGPTALRGTLIRYRHDSEIFDSDAAYDLSAIRRRLAQLAGLCPKLELSFQGESLHRPAGLMGWTRELGPDVLKETELFASGVVDDVRVEAAIAWSPSGKSPRILSFVNCSETAQAGSHAEGLKSAVSTVPPKKLKKQVLDGLVAVVHVYMMHPRFKGPTKAQLHVEAARVAVDEVVKRAILNAPWWWDRLHEALG